MITLGFPPYKIEIDNKLVEVEFLANLVETVMNAGKSGLTTQRYKGLGEMNPVQLRETTMAPDTRRLVKLEAGAGDDRVVGGAGLAAAQAAESPLHRPASSGGRLRP